jgi:microcystin-dependent protein
MDALDPRLVESARKALSPKEPPAPALVWRYGTCTAVAGGTASVVMDEDAATNAVTPVTDWVGCAVGARVGILCKGTQWVVVAASARSGGGGGCPYAIDDIYMTASTVAPATRWPGTTWSLFGAGRVPVCVDSSDADINAAGKTVGAKTVLLAATQMPSHTHTGPSHTHTSAAHTHTGPSHSHGLQLKNLMPDGTQLYCGSGGYASTVWGSGTYGATDWLGRVNAAGTGATGSTTPGATGAAGTGATGATGGGTAHENRQPSIACYVWRRTA